MSKNASRGSNDANTGAGRAVVTGEPAGSDRTVIAPARVNPLNRSVAQGLVIVTSGVLLSTGFIVLYVGGTVVQAVVWAVLLALATRIVPILGSFVIAWWPHPGRGVPPLGIAAAARAVGRELLATLRLFFFYHPFEKWVTRREPRIIERGQTPVVLVHGFYSNAGFWHRMKPGLERAGYRNLFAINLEPPFAGIDQHARRLAESIGEVCARCGTESALVIAHSMGGLVGRVCLRDRPQRIRHLVCLGTPQRGTRLASLVPGESTRQMRPGSAWLRELNADPVEAPSLTNIYSEHDNIIVPQTNAVMDGGREITMQGIGHLDMAFSPELLEKVQSVLAQMSRA